MENTPVVFDENAVTPARRERIVSLLKNKINKATEKVKKTKRELLRNAYKELLEKPDPKVLPLGKLVAKKHKDMETIEKAFDKKQILLDADFLKKAKVVQKKRDNARKLFDMALKVFNKEDAKLNKELNAKSEKLEKEEASKLKPLTTATEKAIEKAKSMGYNVDMNEKKLIRPLFKTDADGKRMLAGTLAKETKEEFKAKVEELDTLKDNAEIAIESGSTKLDTMVEDLSAFIDELTA